MKTEVNTISEYLTTITPLPPYLPYPRFLLTENLSLTAKLLYTLLLDRATLSQKNSWVDERGFVYVIFPLSSLSKVLQCSTSSATYQLMISGGDVKAVQGTTGHATADMLVNTYAHIQQSSRVELGKKFEEGFYVKPGTPSPQAVPAEGEPTISVSALVELLKNADPEVKAQLRLALLT